MAIDFVHQYLRDAGARSGPAFAAPSAGWPHVDL
jgi:hypothetical protein